VASLPPGTVGFRVLYGRSLLDRRPSVKTISFAPYPVALLLAACGGESVTNGETPERSSCQAASLPLEGNAEAPRLSDVFLDCTGSAVELLAVVTDSGGSDDLHNVPQVLRVHRSGACDEGVLEIADDIAVPDEVEAFGVVFEESALPDVYAAICGSERWPVDVELRDSSGHVSSGRVWATVTGNAP
jgi:hypothetical protein